MRSTSMLAAALFGCLSLAPMAQATPADAPSAQTQAQKAEQLEKNLAEIRATSAKLLNLAPKDVVAMVKTAELTETDWRTLTPAQKESYLSAYADGLAVGGRLFHVMGPGHALTEAYVDSLHFGAYIRTHKQAIISFVDARFKNPKFPLTALPSMIASQYLEANPAARNALIKRADQSIKEMEQAKPAAPKTTP